MAITFGNQPCVDPKAVIAYCARKGLPTDWVGLPNSFVTMLGARPGYGWLLMQRANLNLINKDGLNDLIFNDNSGGQVRIKDLLFVRARCVTPGLDNDPAACFMVEVADLRHLAANEFFANPADVFYNCLTTGTTFDPDSLNSGSEWTWQGMATDLWDNYVKVSELGPSPTLPFSPDAKPQNFRFREVPAWIAYNAVLQRIGCGFCINPLVSGIGYIEQIGGTDVLLATAENLYRAKRVLDNSYIEGNRAKFPASVDVTFHKNTTLDDDETSATVKAQWGATDVYVVNVPDPTATVGVENQSKAILYDDLTAQVVAGIVTNTTALNTRAAERAADYYRMLKTGGSMMTRTYMGIIDHNGFLPGLQVSGLAWKDVGAGYFTDVIRRPPQTVSQLEYLFNSAQGSGGDATLETVVILTEYDDYLKCTTFTFAADVPQIYDQNTGRLVISSAVWSGGQIQFTTTAVHGLTANATAVSASPAAAGTGYVVNEILTLVGGTFTTAATFKVLSVVSVDHVATIEVVNAGSYSVTPVNPVTTTSSGAGTGCTLNVVFTGNSITVENANPTGYNGTYVLVSTPTTTVAIVAQPSDPGTYVGCGTIIDESKVFFVAKPYDLQRTPWDGQVAGNEDGTTTVYNYTDTQLSQRIATTGTLTLDGNCNALMSGGTFLFSSTNAPVTENVYTPYREGEPIAVTSGPTGLAAVLKGRASGQSKASATTLVFPAVAVTTGDLIVVLFGDLIGSGSATIADSLTNTWTALDSSPVTNTVRASGWSSIATKAGDCVVTVTFSSSTAARAGLVVVMQNIIAKDKDIAWTSTSGGTITLPSTGTLASNYEIVLGFITLANPDSIGEISPSMMIDGIATSGGSSTNNVTIAMSYQIVHATTAVAPGMVSSTANGVVGTCTFKLKGTPIVFTDINEGGKNWQQATVSAGGSDAFLARLTDKSYDFGGFTRYAWTKVIDSNDPPITYTDTTTSGTFTQSPAYHEANADIAVPSVVRLRHGSGGSTSIKSLSSAAVAAGGSGYAVSDVLTISGGTFATAATVTVTAVSSGAITSVTVLDAGSYTVAPTNPASITGGGGSSATLNLTFTNNPDDWYLIEELPWVELIRRTGDFDSLGEIGFIRIWNQNTQDWQDGEEVRVRDANVPFP